MTLERSLVPQKNPRTESVSAEQMLRVHASLDSATIVDSFRRVCADCFGPSETRVFTFVPDDAAHVLPFGPDGNQKPISAPELGESGLFGAAARPIDGAERDGVWRALLPLCVGTEAVGVLQVECSRPVDLSGVAFLRDLARSLAVAVRNGLTFEKTRRLTFTDDLTTLYNSRFMTLYLDSELKRCKRMRAPLTLLFMDLDGFKQVNDSHGHLAGSRTLVEVGTVLEKTVRDADILIRYGGDEFVVVCPETPLSGGLIIAEKIREVIAETTFLKSMGIEARVSASIGIAAYPESGTAARSLITGADRAMYEAKALGKNRVVAAHPVDVPESKKRSQHLP